jgi:hypothetical protein
MSLVGHSRREGPAPLVSACPNLPQNLTSVRTVALGRKVPKLAVSNRSRAISLFDHLVGAGEQRRWDFEAESFGRLKIDDQLEFGRGLHR